MEKVVGCLLVLWSWALTTHAQEDSIRMEIPWVVTKTTSFGYGTASVYDTYLSPLEYVGKSYTFQHERNSHSSLFHSQSYKQQLVTVNFTSTENLAKNATEYSLIGEYRLGFHKTTLEKGNWKLRVGGVWNIAGGMIYNQRNSNNPVSAKAFTNLNLSVQLFYNWKKVVFRWQLDTPIAGVCFSPEYRESYYEISLGNRSGLVHFASLHNQHALQSIFSADLPAKNWIIRVGIESSLYQTHINNLTSHIYSHSLMIGIVNESLSLNRYKSKKKPLYRSPFSE